MMSDENIHITDRFTEEALALLEKYLSEVRISLTNTDLNPEEIEDSINDLRNHIIEHCHFKVSDNSIITAEYVKDSIKKLGDPDVIGKTLQQELEFSDQTTTVIDEERSNDSMNIIPYNPYEIKITAKHVVYLYSLLNWTLTGFIIFIIFGVSSLEFYSLITYLFNLLLFLLITSHASFSTNSFLKGNITINPHIIISPVIYFIMALIKYADNNPNYTLPGMILIWLYFITNIDLKSYIP